MTARGKIAGRLRGFTEPLPLNDFNGYDGYWHERPDDLEPQIRPRWRLAVEKLPDHGSVLDVGCGTGGFLSFLQSQRPGLKLAGTDVSGEAVEQARAAGFDAFQADLASEQLDGEYDYITCFETIEHVHEAERVLVQLRDATRHQIIMSLPNIGYIEHRIRLAVFGRFPNTTLQFHAKEHIRHWTVRDFTDWAAHFGLRVVDVQGQLGSRMLPWRRWPALFSPQVVYTLERAPDRPRTDG